MPPLKILHFADLHVGMENYGKLDPQTGVSTRIRDFLDRLDEVIAYALDHQADLVIFAGDAFKTRDPDPTQQREFARRIKHLADRVPVFMLTGNHDMPNMSGRATSVDIFSTLEVPNITVGRGPGSQVFQTPGGPLFLAWMPFPVRNRLVAQMQDELKGASIEELDRSVERIVNSLLGDYAQEAAQHAMPRVLVGHFTVGGAVFGSERSVMLGRDIAIQKSALADPAWDYVALGHIHKHQNLTAGEPASLGSKGAGPGVRASNALPPVVYPGSLERIDFGEAADPKGFCWINLARGATTWEFVKVHARPFIAIEVDVREAADPTAAVIAKIEKRDIEGAVVKVKIHLREDQQAAFRRREIEHALASASNIASITTEVESETRTVGVGTSPESLTPRQWTERYFLAKKKSPERIEKLLQAAEALFNYE